MKKNFWKRFLPLALIMVLCTPVFATNWVRIGNGHYVDSDSVRPAADYGTYTMRTKYISSDEPLEEINGKDIWTIKTDSFVDCRANFAKTIAYTAYDKKDRVAASGKNMCKHWQEIQRPGSRPHEIYSYVCTDAYLNRRPDYVDLWWY